MSLTWIIGGVAGFVAGALVDAITKKKKMRELQDNFDRCYHNLSCEVAVVAQLNRQIESIKQEWRRLKLFYDSARACQPDGYPTAYDYSVVRSEYRVCVFGKYKSYAGTDTTVCIKAIPIEDGDEDFAIREAEELIEIINKF